MKRWIQILGMICAAQQLSCSDAEHGVETAPNDPSIDSGAEDEKRAGSTSNLGQLEARLMKIDAGARAIIESTDLESNALTEPQERSDFFQQRRRIVTEYQEKFSALYRERFELLQSEPALQKPDDGESFIDATKEKYKDLIEEFETSVDKIK